MVYLQICSWAKLLGKANPLSLREASSSLGNPLGEKVSGRVWMCLCVQIFDSAVHSNVRGSGQKAAQVMRRWTFLQMLKPGTEGRKVRAGWTPEAHGPGKSGRSCLLGKWCWCCQQAGQWSQESGRQGQQGGGTSWPAGTWGIGKPGKAIEQGRLQGAKML